MRLSITCSRTNQLQAILKKKIWDNVISADGSTINKDWDGKPSAKDAKLIRGPQAKGLSLFVTLKPLLHMFDGCDSESCFARDNKNNLVCISSYLSWHNENKGTWLILNTRVVLIITSYFWNTVRSQYLIMMLMTKICCKKVARIKINSKTMN